VPIHTGTVGNLYTSVLDTGDVFSAFSAGKMTDPARPNSQRFYLMSKSIHGSNETSAEQRYAPDEQQPESSTNERAALAEREDGTVRAGRLPNTFPGGAAQDAVPIIQLTADEHQDIDPAAEHQALSEREDGTNIG
jgi:hypothetical protein